MHVMMARCIWHVTCGIFQQIDLPSCTPGTWTCSRQACAVQAFGVTARGFLHACTRATKSSLCLLSSLQNRSLPRLGAGERANDRRLLESTTAAGASGRGLNPNAKDADDVDAESSGTESSDDDSDDDMEALQAELEKIKCVFTFMASPLMCQFVSVAICARLSVTAHTHPHSAIQYNTNAALRIRHALSNSQGRESARKGKRSC